MVYNFRPVPNTDQEKKWSPIIDQGSRYQTMVSNNRPGVSISDQVKKNNILIIFYSFFIILWIIFYIVFIELLTCFWKRNFFQSNFSVGGYRPDRSTRPPVTAQVGSWPGFFWGRNPSSGRDPNFVLGHDPVGSRPSRSWPELGSRPGRQTKTILIRNFFIFYLNRDEIKLFWRKSLSLLRRETQFML